VTFSNAVSKLKAQLQCLFSLKCGKRDVRALSFELSKMSPQVGLAVLGHPWVWMDIERRRERKSVCSSEDVDGYGDCYIQ